MRFLNIFKLFFYLRQKEHLMLKFQCHILASVFTRSFYKTCFSAQISPFGTFKEIFEVLLKSRNMCQAIIFKANCVHLEFFETEGKIFLKCNLHVATYNCVKAPSGNCLECTLPRWSSRFGCWCVSANPTEWLR